MKLNISACQASPANRIYIMDSLSQGELKTGVDKYDKIMETILHEMSDQMDLLEERIVHKKCLDRQSIEEFFDLIKKECNSENLPLIFFDGHGDKEKGFQLSSGEFIDWDSFNKNLEEITYAAQGNLTVVASFCHSMSALKRPSFEKPLPCPFYYGYSDEVSASEVQDEGRLIIVSLIKFGKVDQADKKIKLYSEYDHVKDLISVLLAKFLRPQQNVNKFPELSKGKLRKNIQEYVGREVGVTVGLNKVFTQVFDVSVLIPEVLSKAMHNTERRQRLIEELLSQIEFLKVED